MTQTQWFILCMFIITCWAGNRFFSTYLDKKLELHSRIAHEKTLQMQVGQLELLIEAMTR